MSENEVIVTNPVTGGRKAGNLQRGSLIPPKILLELAEHYGLGASKYEPSNWRKGYDWSLSYDALMRHLLAFWSGEDYDYGPGGTGSKHMTAVIWHAVALSTFMDEHPDLDDRFLPAPKPAPPAPDAVA